MAAAPVIAALPTVVAAITRLPPGYLHTSGSQIVDAAGRPVRIASVGWNQHFGDVPATVNAIAASGLNTIRVS
ncbi:MAG: hypothetical protein PHI71_11935 [Acidiphilium sp.]|nr:hypothetical protein [Acidiphilium sp.]